MCGICGIINFNGRPVKEEFIHRMMNTQRHRGPDDEGTYFDGNVGLGFLRLSILDLSSAGHQPMFDESGRYSIMHNGEVYNYIEIREELQKKGYVFQSNTDTEVILKSFIEWGEECLNRFNGMWAFCIYDKDNKLVFIARDRYGVKPFYYYFNNNEFIFASEIPPILSVIQSKCSPNPQTIFDYLAFSRTDQTEDTFFGGVKKLQHGHCLTISLDCYNFNEVNRQNGWIPIHNTMYLKRWYNLRERVSQVQPFQSIGEFREMFTSAVGIRLRSDVPVGVCLSGGLDSSSIVGVLVNKYARSDLHTFSAVYGSNVYGDESEYIDEFKPMLKNMHYTYPTGDTLYRDMDVFLRAHGEPIPSTSPYAQFKVMELAKENVVVTLDGQGADEQLAGYHYFFGFYFKELFKRFQLLRLGSEVFNYLINQRSLLGLKTFGYFMLPENKRGEIRIKEKGYLKSSFVNNFIRTNQVTRNIYGSDSLMNALLDHFEYKLEHLLKWEDRNSMWFSLEARVPFLDYRLVEKTLTLDPEWIIRKGSTKYILRESMNGILPPKIKKRRDKIGFATPAADWFRSKLFKDYICDILLNSPILNDGIIDRVRAMNIYEKHLRGKIDANKEIWKWINLDKWYCSYF
jgi:asparagine synthase (glutamine-hydrolysing)